MKPNENLIVAISNRNLDGVNEFIRQGANVNRFKYNKMSPLVYALCSIRPSESGTIDEIISRLIDAGADVNARLEGNRMSATILAMNRNRNEYLILKFINAGTDVSLKCRKRQTALIHAIINNCGKNVIRALIDKGSDVNIGDDGKTPFYYAVWFRKDPDIIEMMLDAGAETSAAFPKPFLAFCCQERCNIDGNCRFKRITDILIRKGANIKERDSRGNNIIHLSICNYVLFLAKRKGVSLDEKNDIGLSPLLKSILESEIDKFNDLLLIGADPNWRDSDGNTLLHFSKAMLRESTVTSLLYHGINFLAVNNDGETPIRYNIKNLGLPLFTSNLYGMKSLILHYLLYEDEKKLDDVIMEGLKDNDDLKNKFITFISICKKEINVMRETFLTNDLSIYQFCHLKRYYKSRYIPIEIEQYVIDHFTISLTFKYFNEVIRIRLLDNSRNNFKRLLLKMLYSVFVCAVVSPADESESGSPLIYDCLYIVGKYLSFRQLYALIEASIDR